VKLVGWPIVCASKAAAEQLWACNCHISKSGSASGSSIAGGTIGTASGSSFAGGILGSGTGVRAQLEKVFQE